jgi:hypothetical protein
MFSNRHLKTRVYLEPSNANFMRVMDLITSENLIVKNIIVPHSNIRKYTCNSSDGRHRVILIISCRQKTIYSEQGTKLC